MSHIAINTYCGHFRTMKTKMNKSYDNLIDLDVQNINGPKGSGKLSIKQNGHLKIKSVYKKNLIYKICKI